MAKVQLAAKGDLGELLTLLAQEAAMTAGDRGVAFFYDFRGPSANVEPYRLRLEAGTRSLLARVAEVKPGGAVFFSAEVIETGPRAIRLLLQVVDTGLPPSEPTVNVLVNGISTSYVATSQDSVAREDLETVKAISEQLRGTVSMGSAPAEGSVVRVELALDVERLEADHTAALEHGGSAWLLGEPPIVFESVIRRMHRLGWRIHLFRSVMEAREALEDATVKRPDVVIGAEHYNVSLPEFLPFAKELAPSCAVYMTLLSSTSLKPDGLGFVENVQVYVNPFSPAELYQITVRALAKMDKVLRLSVSPEKALSRRPRALLVEDNALNQYLSTEVLRLFGFEVDVVNNGQEAVDYFGHELPALVIMDINMPVMDGFEATRQIREFEHRGVTPHVAIVASTAQDDPGTRAMAKRVGMDGFVAKPIDIGFMQREIARALLTTPFELPEEIRASAGGAAFP